MRSSYMPAVSFSIFSILNVSSNFKAISLSSQSIAIFSLVTSEIFGSVLNFDTHSLKIELSISTLVVPRTSKLPVSFIVVKLLIFKMGISAPLACRLALNLPKSISERLPWRLPASLIKIILSFTSIEEIASVRVRSSSEGDMPSVLNLQKLNQKWDQDILFYFRPYFLPSSCVCVLHRNNQNLEEDN